MKMMLSLEPQLAKYTFDYTQKVLLIGSCFSDNMGARLQKSKFDTLFNPTGIVYNPISLSTHLTDYVLCKKYEVTDLFEHNGLWNSWNHHSDFSFFNSEEILLSINENIQSAHKYLKSASFLFITLGTAFSYQLIEENLPVANCHKVPKNWFTKNLLTVEVMMDALQTSLTKVLELNPTIKIVFTISPVKHLRDGIIENNRSKSRLLETVHGLTEIDNSYSYFPAYELVNDVLRDYRFYATDMAHPSEQAVDFVFEFFCKTYFTSETQQLMQEVIQIVAAKNHRVLHPQSEMHKQFLQTFKNKIELIKVRLPMLNWEEELQCFKGV